MRSEKALQLPNNRQKLLLHTCCAPCCGGIIETLLENEIDFTLFFYNPNIHPQEEYELRKNEIKRFADKKNIAFVDADYDPDTWLSRVHGLDAEPERGARCSICFDIRLGRTAKYADKHGFDVFATSLGISRWKDLEQVNQSGLRAVPEYSDTVFWPHNWRKDEGSLRSIATAKQENFYRQKYCGCVYSQYRKI
ncbi:MAG: epoxyqueuosine reductase QueH [Candidatus Omnitrophica bacterium]|nr:epoxyqueuosine reductase QueH [Candidatus Omnitrophota bacterium]